MTLVELVVATAILGILASLALPLGRVVIQREKERELRRDLREMRNAIDLYYETGQRGGFRVKVDTEGYPPTLKTLVRGVRVHDHRFRFLRRIPVDPMTGSKDWGLRSVQDPPDSDSWGGQDVFDVYTKSTATALDGTQYDTW